MTTATAEPEPRTALDTAIGPMLLSARETARLLNVSDRTLWSLTRSGAIRCRRIGRRVLYRRSDVESFVNNG